MTGSIRQSLATLWSVWEDLPKEKDDLARYTDYNVETDYDVEIVEALKHEFTALHERCLQERHVRPSVTINGPVHSEILREAVRQGQERN
jgi:hypothetical protein